MNTYIDAEYYIDKYEITISSEFESLDEYDYNVSIEDDTILTGHFHGDLEACQRYIFLCHCLCYNLELADEIIDYKTEIKP